MGRPRLPVEPEVEAHRSYQRARATVWREKMKPVFREQITAFLAHPCVDCGVSWPLAAMHPDHVRGEKKYKISWFAGGNGTQNMLDAELAKCEPRCANCHCVRHAEGTWRATL